MSDLRARLAAALRESMPAPRNWTTKTPETIVDVLMAMPDIAIVPLALLEKAERQCLDEYEHRSNSFVWAPTALRWKHKAEGIRYAIETASALAGCEFAVAVDQVES
jgi:hypothetical protein